MLQDPSTPDPWKFNSTKDGVARHARKIQARIDAIRINQTLDKSKINDDLLSQLKEFENTPAYVSVTKRLFKLHPSARRDFEMSNESSINKKRETRASLMDTDIKSNRLTLDGFALKGDHNRNRSTTVTYGDVARPALLDIDFDTTVKTKMNLFQTMRNTANFAA